ncbi:MAG TPA: DUF433 domain-containing protein [Candidatus Limnocylindria bacterium]|nr:DUF433 domain-containing protein [Candidatus Limnocylindria bacterium]
MKTYYISTDKKIAGGSPVITGTRIPVQRLQYLVEHGYTEDKIRKEFSGIPIKKIRGALSELTGLGLEQVLKTK